MKSLACFTRTSHIFRIFVWCGVVFFSATNLAFSETINVGTAAELHSAVTSANASGGNTIILLRDGIYTLNDTLYINVPNVTIASLSGVRENVVVQGDAMSSTANIGNLIKVSAKNFQLSGVTLQRSRWHLIQIAGESNADAPVIRNCILRDAYEQIIKVSVNLANPSVASDDGLVENCLFEYSAGIGPQYYIGGIDAHGSRNWVVRNNTFRSIISPSASPAEFAVHFWNGSANNTVEKNLIVDCDRGIGFGLDTRGNSGGIIRNNMIYSSANAGQFADVGISLTESPNSQVYNNTVIREDGFPWAIEYRYASTSNVLIANNLTNKSIISRDGASGTISKNVTSAISSWFIKAASGDLHLASAISSVTGAGQPVAGLTDDFDGQSRPTSVDIGADQFLTAPVLPAPGNLRVVTQ